MSLKLIFSPKVKKFNFHSLGPRAGLKPLPWLSTPWIGLRLLLVGIFSLALMGCSTTGRSVATGAAVGAVAGATTGAWTDADGSWQRAERNVLTGSLIGAGLGALVGYIIDKSQKGRNKGKGGPTSWSPHPDPSGVPRPNIFIGEPSQLADGIWEPSQIERKYIEGYVDGNVYHEPHFIWILKQPGRFKKD